MLQYVDSFYARMELLKKESIDWDTTDYEEGMVQKLAYALETKSAVVAAEESLHRALRARSVDTQLSQDMLLKLKV